MRESGVDKCLNEKIVTSEKNSRNSLFFLAIFTFLVIAMMLTVFSGTQQGYSGVTITCISCHNDTDYPNDTNLDGRPGPFKRPHNNTVMCENCHLTNPHTVVFIQPAGTYGSRSAAASCPECHQSGIPGNANFSMAPLIQNPLSHSDNISNGTNWGNYWNATGPRTACIFCHNDTIHNMTPFGRILEWSPDYKMYGEIGGGYTCAGCHYRGEANWTLMSQAFLSAGLPIPPEITNGTSWNGITHKYYNHSFDIYDDQKCKSCHGSLLSASANMSEFVHNVGEAAGGECIGCHASRQGDYPGIELAAFGRHRDVNKTDGNDNLTNGDCTVCHYDFNYTEMILPGFTTTTYACPDCHLEGNFSAPLISNHRPPENQVAPNARISTGTYCSTCHNNSINAFAYSINASSGHYATNASLIKPTANETTMPRYGFMTQAEASSYNAPCNNCHNPQNLSYGAPPRIIQTGHTALGACNQCHANATPDNLHDQSLSLPETFRCIDCHRTYADKYGAPNLTGTGHLLTACNNGNCHMTDSGTKGEFDVQADHNASWSFNPSTPPVTDTVYLNGATTLSVSRGTIVTVTSRIKDGAGDASRVRGAEYYIATDPGIGKGIYMNASDGMFNAANGAWENVTGTMDTSALSSGTYTVYVRGMDIGKQWSSSQSATLTILPPMGFVNGTVRNSIDWPIKGAIVIGGGKSATTTDDGNYSLSLEAGTYNVTAIKQPEYYDTTVPNVDVISSNTTQVNIVVIGKPTGTLSGMVITA